MTFIDSCVQYVSISLSKACKQALWQAFEIIEGKYEVTRREKH